MGSTLLTVAQTKQIEVAAALLRLDQRETFLRSVATQLGRFPTDHDVSCVIRDTIGVVPFNDDHLGNLPTNKES